MFWVFDILFKWTIHIYSTSIFKVEFKKKEDENNEEMENWEKEVINDRNKKILNFHSLAIKKNVKLS